jgi:hypothetical protein
MIKQILSEEYFNRKSKQKPDLKPLPPIFNPRPKFFVFGKISKQSNFLQLTQVADKAKKSEDGEEDYFGLVNPDKIVSNELNTIRVYETKNKYIKKPTIMKKPTRNKSSQNTLIDLVEDNYIDDARYFDDNRQ